MNIKDKIRKKLNEKIKIINGIEIKGINEYVKIWFENQNWPRKIPGILGLGLRENGHLMQN